MSEAVADWTEHGATAMEGIATIVLVVGVVSVLVTAAAGLVTEAVPHPEFSAVRRDLARVLLVGLEILVAADIIETVSVGVDFRALGFLAGIVAIRIALSWSLEMETTGRWPWQQPAPRAKGGVTPSGG